MGPVPSPEKTTSNDWPPYHSPTKPCPVLEPRIRSHSAFVRPSPPEAIVGATGVLVGCGGAGVSVGRGGSGKGVSVGGTTSSVGGTGDGLSVGRGTTTSVTVG